MKFTTTGKRKAEEPAVDESPVKKQKVENTKLKKVKVDPFFSGSGKVYTTADEVYAVTLNQTNVKHNNNKYYIIQLIDTGGSYYVFTRWGRVGEDGRYVYLWCLTSLVEMHLLDLVQWIRQLMNLKRSLNQKLEMHGKIEIILNHNHVNTKLWIWQMKIHNKKKLWRNHQQMENQL